nr:MAG TPA: hypothetical protein [Caudoviricetes sp.]
MRCKEAKQNLLLTAVKHYKNQPNFSHLLVYMMTMNLIQ